MSGIYGSTNRKMYLKLQELNKNGKRVNHSSLLIKDDFFDIQKIHALVEDEYKIPRKKYEMYLGVFSTKTRSFEPDLMDPVMYDQWMIGACGESLEIKDSKYALPKKEKLLFSEIIGCIIADISSNSKKYNEVKIISDALSAITGKFAFWFYSMYTKNIFLAKCNKEIYANIYDNTFSSFPFEDSEPLMDGDLYQLTREGITAVSIFDCDMC
jgi:hypothetical protein